MGQRTTFCRKERLFVTEVLRFGSSVDDENTFGLVGCMVAPGFDFVDFELFTQQQLLALYPQHEAVIKKMAYEQI